MTAIFRHRLSEVKGSNVFNSLPNFVILCCLVLSCLFILSLEAHAQAQVDYWYDYGYAPGELSMPPSGNGRKQDWHNRWPGHPGMTLTPAFCSYEGQGLKINCSGCSGGFTCRLKKVDAPVDPVDPAKGNITLTLPPPAEPPQCMAGNPIAISTGVKIQEERDIDGLLPFTRFYSSASWNEAAGGWRHNYQGQLEFVDLPASEYNSPVLVSKGYQTKLDACKAGWTDLQSQIDTGWSQQATAEFDQVTERCEIRINGVNVASPSYSQTQSPSDLVSVVRLTRPNGGVLTFRENSAGTWLGLAGSVGRLEEVAGQEWRFIDDDNRKESYNLAGQLILIEDQGSVVELAYDGAGRLTEVANNRQQRLEFEYFEGKLAAVTKNGASRYEYNYDTRSRLEEVRYPDETRRRYHYEDEDFPRLLTGITNENGSRYASWQYDEQGRGVKSWHAEDVDLTTLRYNGDGSTTVINPLGKETTYYFERIAGVSRVVKVVGHATSSCDGANQNYTYTVDGRLESKTDWKGVKTEYRYNNRGLIMQLVEAVGTPVERRTNTEWHPEFRLPVRIEAPYGTFELTYDGEGRLISKVQIEN